MTMKQQLYRWRELYGQDSWKLLLALSAILDLCACWPILLDAWLLEAASQDNQAQTKIPLVILLRPGSTSNHSKRGEVVDDWDNVCPAASTVRDTSTLSTVCGRTPRNELWMWMGFVFCFLCILEAIRRALEARQLALDNAALDKFEQKLANLYQATRCNVFRKQPGTEDYDKAMYQEDNDMLLARSTVRVWTPVAAILLFWMTLLPWQTFFKLAARRSLAGYTCRGDSSMATIWISSSRRNLSNYARIIKHHSLSFLWDVALPFTLLQPLALWRRIRLLSRWFRYLRFAGPLLRMLLKLQDQFWVFTRTWRQAFQAQAERAKRMAHRNLVLEDIRRIESLAKVQHALASLPSQIIKMASSSSSDFPRLFREKQQRSRRLHNRLESLKKDLRQSSRFVSTSEIYDRMVDLTQELSNTLRTTLWSSNLISPHTRFSVGWRIVVTVALLSELVRLSVSWNLSKTFAVRYTDITRQLLIQCETKSRPLRRIFGRILRIPQDSVVLNTCMPTSPSGLLALQFARASEIVIDLVCFLDIFVWFFTGELDVSGVVVPKPFFTRCVLPGTLVQVFDHPTLPDKLPKLVFSALAAVDSVGYSRVIRWGLAISPALQRFFGEPLQKYLFRPMEEQEYLKYTESLAIIPRFSNADFFQVPIRRNSTRSTVPTAASCSSGGGGAPWLTHAPSMAATSSASLGMRRMGAIESLSSCGLESEQQHVVENSSQRRLMTMDDSLNIGGYGLYY